MVTLLQQRPLTRRSLLTTYIYIFVHDLQNYTFWSEIICKDLLEMLD